MKVIIYSDGGADPNPGIGGWAAVLKFGEREKELTGGEPHTTNNRMELTAALAALESLQRPSDVDFYTDSQYLRKGITLWLPKWEAANWRRKGNRPIQNLDLWQRLAQAAAPHTIEWSWVKAHAGHPMNERVDRLAREARLAISPEQSPTNDGPRLFVRASCKGNPGPGGWGAVLEQAGATTQRSGFEPQTTNNRMEIAAVIEGIRLLPPGPVQVVTMSDYLFQGATRWIHGWRQRQWRKKDGQPVANADLWRALLGLEKRYQIEWVNAKGQQLAGLDEAARLAGEAMRAAAAG